MLIIINSIQANLIDVSTSERSDYIIDGYTISYFIPHADETGEHSIGGSLKWTAVPDIQKIIKFITWFYTRKNTTTKEPT